MLVVKNSINVDQQIILIYILVDIGWKVLLKNTVNFDKENPNLNQIKLAYVGKIINFGSGLKNNSEWLKLDRNFVDVHWKNNVELTTPQLGPG